MLDEKILQLEKVHTYENGTDMMTKILSKEKQGTCRRLAGMYITSLARSNEISLFGLEVESVGWDP